MYKNSTVKIANQSMMNGKNIKCLNNLRSNKSVFNKIRKKSEHAFNRKNASRTHKKISVRDILVLRWMSDKIIYF